MVVFQFEEIDLYQGIASAMPHFHVTQTALAAGLGPRGAAAKADVPPSASAACLKACPDTNLPINLGNHGALASISMSACLRNTRGRLGWLERCQNWDTVRALGPPS
jgi:hypothetical protein